jgi:hypothetical protein
MSSDSNLDFFHTFIGSSSAGWEEDCPASPCSAWIFFFDSYVFMGEDFILVVTSVFTRIRSKATRVATVTHMDRSTVAVATTDRDLDIFAKA